MEPGQPATPYTVTWDDIVAPIVFLIMFAGAVMWDSNKYLPVPAPAAAQTAALADAP